MWGKTATACHKCGGEGQQHAATPDHAPTNETETRWLAVFGELSAVQARFLTNAVKGYSTDEVLTVLDIADASIRAGTAIARPAAYIKKVLGRRVAKIVTQSDTQHRQAADQPAAGAACNSANHIDPVTITVLR